MKVFASLSLGVLICQMGAMMTRPPHRQAPDGVHTREGGAAMVTRQCYKSLCCLSGMDALGSWAAVTDGLFNPEHPHPAS